MKARTKHTKEVNRKPLSDALLRKLERELGGPNGLDIAISSRASEASEDQVHYYYSNKLDKLRLKGGRELQIAVSSVEEENEQLLHFLLTKTEMS